MAADTVVVAGALANKPGNGGEAWVRMSWVVGLARLGFDVWFVEELPGDAGGSTADDVAVRWFRDVTQRFGVDGRAVLLRTPRTGRWTIDRRVSADVDVAQLLDDCTLLINISGALRNGDLIGLAPCAVYVDLDPGFTQVWAAQGAAGLGLEHHQLHFTVGERIGTPNCRLPTAGFSWLPCRQPVVLDDWPVTPIPEEPMLTTVATWRCPFGPLEWEGTTYGLKVHEFRDVIDVPQHSSLPLELALDLHPADEADSRLLTEHGWRVRAASAVCATPDAFRSYVQSSAGEFTVAQGVYARARTGWFSDRTARYLASGRPVIVQDTGWGDGQLGDDGLLTFTDRRSAIESLGKISADLECHSKAARQIAEERFGSDDVLTRFLAHAMARS